MTEPTSQLPGTVKIPTRTEYDKVDAVAEVGDIVLLKLDPRQLGVNVL